MAGAIRPVLILLISLLIIGPLSAQSLRFDGVGMQELCAQGGCVSGVQVQIDQLQRSGMSTADINSQLGIIAAILFQAANGADPELLSQLIEAFLLLALFSTDATQQESFIWVAGQISDGAIDLFDLATPFAVSPT